MGLCASSPGGASGGAPDSTKVAPASAPVVNLDSHDPKDRKASMMGNASKPYIGGIKQKRASQCTMYENMVLEDHTHEIREVYEGVDDGKQLGSGLTGTVRVIRDRATQQKFALKIVRLKKLSKSVLHERQMHGQLQQSRSLAKQIGRRRGRLRRKRRSLVVKQASETRDEGSKRLRR